MCVFLLFVGKFYVFDQRTHRRVSHQQCQVILPCACWLAAISFSSKRKELKTQQKQIDFLFPGLTPWTGWSGCGYVGCHLPFRKVTSSFRIHVYIDMVYLSTFGWFSWNMEIDRYKSTMYGSCSIRIFLFLLMLRFRQILMIRHSIFGKLEDTSNGNTIPSRESPANIEVVPTHNYHIAWLVEVIIMLKIFEDDREWQVRFVVSMGIN